MGPGDEANYSTHYMYLQATIVVPLNKTIQRKELVLVSTALTVCLKQQVIDSPHDVLYVGGIVECPWQ